MLNLLKHAASLLPIALADCFGASGVVMITITSLITFLMIMQFASGHSVIDVVNDKLHQEENEILSARQQRSEELC